MFTKVRSDMQVKTLPVIKSPEIKKITDPKIILRVSRDSNSCLIGRSVIHYTTS